MSRLPSGGLIDRTRSWRFRFDGREYAGHPGDTLASALLANDVRLVGRSFKLHRPRGILSAGPEEPNALVELREGARREPNTRATVAELYDGLRARSQNRFPSLHFDLMAANSLVAPLLHAGFYYKTFMWPASFWEKVYEPLIRRAAGLGRAAEAADPDHYELVHVHCDVLVIGAGPAGLMAALAAGRAGARVILCDEDFSPGGRLLAEGGTIGGEASSAWAASVAAELGALANVRVLARTTVFGVYDSGTFGAVQRVGDHLAEPATPRQRVWRIVARRSVLAAGAIERPLVFANNDRPGVMLAGAVRTYLNRFAVAPGKRAVVFATHDDGSRTARALLAAGIGVAALVDPRPDATAPEGVRLVRGVVGRALGGQTVRGAEVTAFDGASARLDCDLLAMSGGWSPSIHLTSHLGARPRWDEALAAFVPAEVPAGMAVAGAASGEFTAAQALGAGARAGAAAAEATGFQARLPNIPDAEPETTAHRPLWRVRGVRGKAFIDFQNDVATGDVELAEREGFRAVEHLKRYTTLGMATDQGKTANINGLALMAELTDRTIAETGTTRFRPPYTPVAIGALAGHHRGRDFRPTRLTPTHEWSAALGAVFVEAGLWMRAQYYPRPDETGWLQTVNREVSAVRAAVGVCDVSTLGKIDLQGPDSAAFLDRLYVNRWSTLRVGRARYGLMLREDGFAFDDGTISRLAEDRFLVTTTTANAAAVLAHMEFCHQVLWPDLDVQFVSVTDQWGQLAIAGPRARDVISRIVAADIADAALPYMAAAEVNLSDGTQARVFRISFSGELAYELAVPARAAGQLARRVMEAGQEYGITAYGTEAMGVMRIEKGHVAGNEINGQTTAADLSLGRLVARGKDCIGAVMAGRPGLTDPTRPRLIGARPVNPADRLRAGAHFIPVEAAPGIANDEGFLSSVAFSPTVGSWIGLGFLARGAERIGEQVRAVDPVRGGDVRVEVCDPVFVDPEGGRLRG